MKKDNFNFNPYSRRYIYKIKMKLTCTIYVYKKKDGNNNNIFSDSNNNHRRYLQKRSTLLQNNDDCLNIVIKTLIGQIGELIRFAFFF